MLLLHLLPLLLLLAQAVQGQSCEGRCNDPPDTSLPCQCNHACNNYNDCCEDYQEICGEQQPSCKGQCGASYDPSLQCQCNDQCPQHGNCCPDFDSECGGSTGGGLTDSDLLELGEILLAQDDDNVAGMYVVDLQCTTNNGNPADCSPLPLFERVDPAVLEIPVYKKLAALYDNYYPDPSDSEDQTQEEVDEEMEFMAEVMNSAVMNSTYYFLNQKGAFPGTWEEWGEHVYNTWFGMYSRPATDGSSGFEHVFVGECCKKGEVGGFHNWFHYYLLEQAGKINYLGHWEYVDLGQKGNGISFTFTWNGAPKPYGSAFIGTSPSLELALYTTCLLTRPDAKCHTVLGGQDVYIQTWRENQGGQIYPGSSYPDWS